MGQSALREDPARTMLDGRKLRGVARRIGEGMPGRVDREEKDRGWRREGLRRD